LRYRSGGGLAIFGAWGVAFTLLVGLELRSNLSDGEPPWFAVAWMIGILVLALASTSVQLTVAADGEMQFRSVLGRRRWDVSELRSVRPGAACRVFRFAHGTALLPSTGGEDWDAVVARILGLNPTVRVVDRSLAVSDPST
jgi:hypothetical protein